MAIFAKISAVFASGGFLMWLIAILQVFSIVIIVERAIVLYGKRLTESSVYDDARISHLSILGSLAALMGLLGTITGMIRSFAAVSQASQADKAALLSAGISVAIHCAIYGLIVAIPVFAAYAILQNRANHLAEHWSPAGFNSRKGTFQRPT